MPTVETALTDSLPTDVLADLRDLLDAAFGGEFSADDWRHALGGRHVIVRDGGVIVAHAAVVERELDVGGQRFRSGYVEGVATAPARQGQGFGTAAMRAAAGVIREQFEIGALSTGEHHFYERLGWRRWRGPTFVRDGDALLRTEDEDDGVMVLSFGPSADIHLTAAITCEARAGDDW